MPGRTGEVVELQWKTRLLSQVWLWLHQQLARFRQKVEGAVTSSRERRAAAVVTVVSDPCPTPRAYEPPPFSSCP